MSDTKQEKNTRRADHYINSLFVNRWSPRSMTGEEIDDTDLMSIFEAARWAPSFNFNLGDLYIQKEQAGNGPNS
ncbi:hypothetical protein BH23THE1_BH23THE1_24080 [soil metagenome]